MICLNTLLEKLSIANLEKFIFQIKAILCLYVTNMPLILEITLLSIYLLLQNLKVPRQIYPAPAL